MTTNINLIISTIILIIIVIYKIIIFKYYKKNEKRKLYKKTKILYLSLMVISAITFILSLIINIYIYGNENTTIKTITYIINALSISIIPFPISLISLYQTSFKDEELISHTKTIITDKIDNKTLKKYNKAGINIILLSKEEMPFKIKIINEEEINYKILKKNIQIKTSNKKILNDLINKDTTITCFTKHKNLYNKLKNARGIHDNYIRTIKYLILTYLPLLLSYFFINLIGFPITYNILFILLFKVYTIITSEYVYKKLPFDDDLMLRKPKLENILIGKQETIFLIIESFCIFFALNIPYMFVFVSNGDVDFANTLYFTIFIYTNIFITLSNISDSNILKNLFKSIRNIPLLVYIFISFILTIIINFTTYFNTTNIGVHNYISCILFSLIAISINELIKLARFTTTKGTRKK